MQSLQLVIITTVGFSISIIKDISAVGPDDVSSGQPTSKSNWGVFAEQGPTSKPQTFSDYLRKSILESAPVCVLALKRKSGFLKGIKSFGPTLARSFSTTTPAAKKFLSRNDAYTQMLSDADSFVKKAEKAGRIDRSKIARQLKIDAEHITDKLGKAQVDAASLIPQVKLVSDRLAEQHFYHELSVVQLKQCEIIEKYQQLLNDERMLEMHNKSDFVARTIPIKVFGFTGLIRRFYMQGCCAQWLHEQYVSRNDVLRLLYGYGKTKLDN